MNMKRITLLVLVFFLNSGFTDKGMWIIDSDSKLTIQGSTNINEFSCKINYYLGADTLQYEKNYNSGMLVFSNNCMSIPITNFECDTKQISRDFRESLKAETYPDLTIYFRSLECPGSKNGLINGVVDISLAGATTQYTIQYKVTVKDKKTILLKGIRPVAFSDFKLVPPKKLQGLIRVDEILNVEFDLVLKQI